VNNSTLLDDVRPGLIIAGLVLLFGILMGVVMGIFEESIKDILSAAVEASSSVHVEGVARAKEKIFRWWQRAHFHAVGIGAFTLVMITITAISGLKPSVKRWASILIAMGGLYSFAWFLMALKAPSVGRPAAHHYLPVEMLVYISMVCLFIGMAILFANITFKLFSDK
jgi:hypothetical protein